MRHLLNPKWLLIVNTIPTAILFFMFWNEYAIIKSLLSDESIEVWKSFASALSLLGILNLIYAIFLIIKKKEVSLLYGLTALLTYIPFLYLYGFYSDKIIPSYVPQWMVSSNMILYVGTFIMPTLSYCLLVLVTHLTPENKPQKPWINFLMAILIPIGWYILSQIILPFWHPVESGFSIHSLVIFIIVGTLIFLFFLTRGIYILGLKKASSLSRYKLAWKIPIAIIFPLLGLAINNGHLFNNLGLTNTAIFGDFSASWFHTLAILNGIFICLPNSEKKIYRLLLFIGRSITFTYTLYFFLVFLPFLPLSIIAIVAIGVGFLMLTPLALFIIHIHELSNDFDFLKNFFSKKTITTLFILGVLIIPFFITLSYLQDKKNLNAALEYIYTPNYSKEYNINTSSLSKTLSKIKKHRIREQIFILGNQTPYLSSYFNWLVLDNLTLSYEKISTIEKIFFNINSFEIGPANTKDSTVQLSAIQANSHFDENQNAWISQIDLEITNYNENSWLTDYTTIFTLPDGCWISDYYLYIGDKKEMGLLAEKKAAMWVFSQIHHTNRDPGILHYLTGNKISFTVFPFSKGETRKTGIELIHKEPIKLNIDNNIITLGNYSEKAKIQTAENTTKRTIYISSKEKASLKKVQRTPYYHFIVDLSKEKEKYKEEFIQRIEDLLNKNLISKTKTKISFTNTYTSTFLFDNHWKERFNKQLYEGGFYLDRAIKKILIHSYTNISDSYPLIITVTDSLSNAIIENDFSDLKIAFPESDIFYVLHKNGRLEPHSLSSNPILPLSDSLNFMKFNQHVLAFPNEKNPIAYLPDNTEPNLIFKKNSFNLQETDLLKKNWQSGAYLQNAWFTQILHPELSNKEWATLVRYSFMSKIMTPLTSYIVVENDAQKAILKRKQEQALSGNKSLDLGEEQEMTEPSLILLIALLGLFLWLRKRQYTN